MPIEKLDVNADGDLIASSGHDNKVRVSVSFASESLERTLIVM